MKTTYTIEGMTCMSCVARVTAALESVKEVESAEVELKEKLAHIKSVEPIDLSELKKVLGRYTISESNTGLPLATLPDTMTSFALPVVSSSAQHESPAKAIPDSLSHNAIATVLPHKTWATYKPLFLIVSFIAGVTFLSQFPFDDFKGMLWMRHFMAGFFIVFSFFKLLNLKGFADSYAMYDIIAGRWKGWGLVYPFVELGLGLLYLIGVWPFWTNVIAIVILSVSSIGVIQSNLNKRKIKCACLGDVFNLPMSTVTIIEDVGMVVMAIVMLFIR